MAEGAALEKRYILTGIVGSNPTLSAIRQAHGKPGDWRMILSEQVESKDRQSNPTSPPDCAKTSSGRPS